MSGAKMRSRTVWREAGLITVKTERQHFFAASAGAQLTVILKASEDDTIVTANVITDRQAKTHRFVSPGDTSVRVRNAQIAVAKAWCEAEADRIAAGTKTPPNPVAPCHQNSEKRVPDKKPRVYAEKPCALCHQPFTPTGGRSLVCDRCKANKSTQKPAEIPAIRPPFPGANEAV